MRTFKKRKRRRPHPKLQLFMFCLALLGVFLLIRRVQNYYSYMQEQGYNLEQKQLLDPGRMLTIFGIHQPAKEESAASETKENSSEVTSEELSKEDIYTFSQGPKGWEQQKAWSGSWCREEFNGKRFSVFGCGLCCLANTYSTLTPYECDPIDAFKYAKKVSDYSPTYSTSAIAWKDMKKTLKKMGFTVKLCKKDSTYKKFRKHIKNAMTAIILVSSTNDDSFWKVTKGHYVNLWLYNADKQTVMVGDSGDINRNRKRIKLKTVYNSLKSASNYQYILITGYTESKNKWKHSGIDMDWVQPDYYTPKEASEKES